MAEEEEEDIKIAKVKEVAKAGKMEEAGRMAHLAQVANMSFGAVRVQFC